MMNGGVSSRSLRLLGVAGIVVLLLLAGIFVGGALGDEARSQETNGTATVSPDVQDGDGEEIVLVYFGAASDGPEVSTGTSPNVTVETLKTQASEAQAPFESYAARTQGVTVLRTFWLGNMAAVRIDHDQVAVEALAAIDTVEHVGPNFEVTVDTSVSRSPGVSQELPTYPTPPMLDSLQEDVGSASSHLTYGLDQINASEVWNQYDTKGAGTSVAVLDSGVDPNHPDIDLTAWADWNETGQRRNTNPMDYDTFEGHGTHVSGTVAGGNASGTHIGVAPETDLYHGAIITDCTNDGCKGTGAQIAAGMQWAVDNDVDVMSLSLGNKGYDGGYINLVQDAQNAGTMVVAASGNDGDGTSSSPGNVYNTTAVGASNQWGDISAFSSGETITTETAWDNPPTEWPDEYIVPTVSAPGSAVESALPGGGYGSLSGTSMATPHVSGAVALIQAATEDSLSPWEIEDALADTAFKPSEEDPAQDTRYGHGIIDVRAATDTLSSDQQDPAQFDVTVDSTTSPVTEGDSLSVTVTVENTGDAADSQSIELDIDGVRDVQTVQLDGGQQHTVTLTWATSSGDAGSYQATVRSEDDSALADVVIEQADKTATFGVTIMGSNSPVVENETLEVMATIENTGEELGTQQITLEIDDTTVDSTAVSLNSGGTDTVSLTWDTRTGDVGEYVANVTSDNETATTAVRVQRRSDFRITLGTTNSPVREGESLSVNATVSNAGNGTAEQEIVLVANGSTQSTTNVTLDAGESTEVALYWETDGNDAGTQPVSIVSDDDAASTSVTVEEAVPVALSIDETDAPVVAGENLTVNVTAENTGAESTTQQITLSANGSERDSQTVSLVPGETSPVSLVWETDGEDVGTHDVIVGSVEREASVSVSIESADRSIHDYTNESDIVEVSGVRDAIDDWLQEKIDTGLLNDVIQAWLTGKPVE